MSDDLRTVTCAEWPHLPVLQTARWAGSGRHVHLDPDDHNRPTPCDGRLTASMPGGGG